jgi:hypothetical protein
MFGSERGEAGVFSFILFRLLMDSRFWANNGKVNRVPVWLRLVGFAAAGVAAVKLIPALTVCGLVVALPLWLKAVLPIIVVGLMKVALSKDSLKEKRARFFWGAVAVVTLGFIIYIINFVALHYMFMPIPFVVKLFNVQWFLPTWTKPVLIGLSILPFYDMFFLTFLGMANIGKTIVRAAIGYKNHFYDVKTFSKAMELLPGFLMDETLGEDRQFKFATIIEERNSLKELTEKEYEQFKEFLKIVKGVPANNKAKKDALKKALAILPKALKVKDTEGQIINFVCKFTRKDMAADPQNMDDLRTFNIQVSGFNEAPVREFYDNSFFKVKGLNTMDKDNNAVTTLIGMLASSYSDSFEIFVTRSVKEGTFTKEQGDELLLLTKEPDHILKLFDAKDAKTGMGDAPWPVGLYQYEVHFTASGYCISVLH